MLSLVNQIVAARITPATSPMAAMLELKLMRPDLVATDNPRNPREYLSRLYFDSWVADDRALRYLLDTCGVSQVMLGTDYPFPLGEQQPGASIASLDLTETEQARLYHGTALEWLGLPKSRFE